MADVMPFRGICYDPGKVKADAVMAPPYDVIDPEQLQSLYGRSPYNIARVDAGEQLPGDTAEENKYTRAAALLREWLDSGVLREAGNPCLYAYEVRYAVDGKRKELRGVFAQVRLEPFGSGSIHPHECTHPKARNDRLSLLSATGMNTSPVFSFYENHNSRTSTLLDRLSTGGTPPYLEAADADGFLHRLWVIDNPEETAAFQADLDGKAVFIADGHHRYETALEYQRVRRLAGHGGGKSHPAEAAPFDYVLMFLANMADGGLTVLPTHRLVRGGFAQKIPECLGEHFEVEEVPAGADILKSIRGMKNAFGIYTRGRRYKAVYDGSSLADFHPVLRELDVVILHEFLINRLMGSPAVAYEMDIHAAVRQVDRGLWDAAFFLNPTSINEIMEVALSGQRMPPKSTYFYPKVMTGFVMCRT